MRTFSLLGALATLSGAVDVANAACRAGWTKSGTSCFRLFPENHNYQSAVRTCDAESANVAIIESKEQNDVVAGFLSSGEAFIGLTWSDRYSDFEWSDGNDLRYEASWWHKETRNGGHYCTTVVSATGHWHASGWVNRPCSESKPVVCSMQAHVPKPDPVVGYPIVGYGGKCLSVFQGRYNSNEAIIVAEPCKTGAKHQQWLKDGATIRNPYSNKCIDLMHNSCGSGTDVVLWDCTGKGNQRFTHNPDVFPKALMSQQCLKCLDLNMDSEIGQVVLWRCKWSKNQQWEVRSPSPTPTPVKTCLDGWTKSGKSCFRLFSATHNYQSAAAACGAESATLAMIKSQKQNALVAGLGFRGEAFIGLTWDDWQSTFKWSDGTAPTYEAGWYRKSTRNGGHSCTTIVSASGNWHPSEWVNRPCSQSKPFVCSMKARRYNIGLHDIVV